MHTLPLLRPLNALIVPLRTELGVKHFLVDSGCPVSFAERARRVLAGGEGWSPTRDLSLRPAPFSLHPVSERLGVPLEGFIGAADIIAAGALELSWEERALTLGGAPRAAGLKAPSARRLPLSRALCFFTLRAALDGGAPLSFFIDLGARFINLQPPQVPRAPSAPLHRLHVHTPMGVATHEVSGGHALEYVLGDEARGEGRAEGLCVATGAPPMFPPIIGVEWLSRQAARFEFTEGAPALTLAAPPHAAPRPAWEELSADLWGAPFSVTLDPAQVEEADRPFTLMPLPGRALPEGLLPLTPYRLRGLEVPAGAEGVNVLHEALWVRGGGAASLAPLVLVG